MKNDDIQVSCLSETRALKLAVLENPKYLFLRLKGCVIYGFRAKMFYNLIFILKVHDTIAQNRNVWKKSFVLLRSFSEIFALFETLNQFKFLLYVSEIYIAGIEEG